MDICYNCANVIFEYDVYALTSLSTVRSKAEQGCRGRNFFCVVFEESKIANEHKDAEFIFDEILRMITP